MAGQNGYSLSAATQGQPQFSAHAEGEESEEQRDGISPRDELSPRDGQTSPKDCCNPFYTGQPRSPTANTTHTSIDRQEIIRRIKRGNSRPTSPELERSVSSLGGKRRSPTPLSHSAILQRERPQSPEEDQQTLGMQIERPRSALHRGDFREKEESRPFYQRFEEAKEEDAIPALATSPVAPWHPRFPNTAFRAPYQGDRDRQVQSRPLRTTIRPPSRARATSQASLASTFVYKAPTSPLVQSSRPDTPEPGQGRRSRSPDKSRRHTFSPRSFQHFQSALDYPGSARRQPPTLRAEKTAPYQAHQPRRSLAAYTTFPLSPTASRRPSLSDSPLHHAPMVGSYEESILRGRMSTTPSKPLNFVAQIGVLGKGNCKPNLRCPPHATIPFPAVFYSYGDGARSLLANDQPSPYVGLVDLENNLPAPQVVLNRRRHRLMGSTEGSRESSRTREDGSAAETHARLRRHQKAKRRSGSPKAPPGGAYRIPQQGQLQVIIKNPNKTAVKLFLIPYDLSDMEPGQKTFIRQRSYSAGPILDMPLASRKNYGTDRPEASLSTSDDPNERPTLRYLIHLHICCPSKGRYFLYKSMRVVFANRVPDGKEKLRNEIQLPEPKYSTYKPGRDSLGPASAGQSEKRKSLDEPTTPPSMRARIFQAQSLPAADYDALSRLPQALPFHLPTLESRPASRQTHDSMDVDSNMSNSTMSLRSNLSSPQDGQGRRLDDAIDFSRDQSSDQSGRRSESLLSMRLKEFALQTQDDGVWQG